MTRRPDTSSVTIRGANILRIYPSDVFLDAVPFPFAAFVFMFPKGTIRHPFDPIMNCCRGKAYELIGMRTTMLVPRPAEVRTSSCAPRFLALACILDNPKPSLHAA